MNLSLPPFIALIPYGLILAVIGFFSLVNISHLLRYGSRLSIGAFFTVIYLIGVLVILGLTWQMLPLVSWAESLGFGFTLPIAI